MSFLRKHAAVFAATSLMGCAELWGEADTPLQPIATNDRLLVTCSSPGEKYDRGMELRFPVRLSMDTEGGLHIRAPGVDTTIVPNPVFPHQLPYCTMESLSYGANGKRQLGGMIDMALEDSDTNERLAKYTGHISGVFESAGISLTLPQAGRVPTPAGGMACRLAPSGKKP
jgi:hypothetical protein